MDFIFLFIAIESLSLSLHRKCLPVKPACLHKRNFEHAYIWFITNAFHSIIHSLIYPLAIYSVIYFSEIHISIYYFLLLSLKEIHFCVSNSTTFFCFTFFVICYFDKSNVICSFEILCSITGTSNYVLFLLIQRFIFRCYDGCVKNTVSIYCAIVFIMKSIYRYHVHTVLFSNIMSLSRAKIHKKKYVNI